MDFSPVLSVVVPMFNEEAAVPELVARLRPVLDGCGVGYEVLAVDDGSTDGTGAALLEEGRRWSQLRIVRLRRNSGHQAALTAGLRLARGEWVASIDADLQDPPESLPGMLRVALEGGVDVVYGVRSDRSADTLFKRRTADVYYRLMRRLVGTDVPAHAGDFRLLSREVVDVLRGLPERALVYRLLVPSLGFPSAEVRYVRERRVAGTTKYPLGRMIALAWESTTSFSAAPLRLATWLGLTSFLLCLLLMAFGTAAYATGAALPGWTSLFLAVLLLSGLQLLCLGLLGEYVGRIYAAVQNRPAFQVCFDSAEESHPARTTANTPSRKAFS
ncbi:glycosyltransferase family 2 protein [Kitasatospora sp. HPMI-4]|uniref:glycosyltransferase family 2 protein n=1 Tax=Kitasatospora sp. HPMI-4 TaxID=3448443 RepID=UPI003F1E2287